MGILETVASTLMGSITGISNYGSFKRGGIFESSHAACGSKIACVLPSSVQSCRGLLLGKDPH